MPCYKYERTVEDNLMLPSLQSATPLPLLVSLSPLPSSLAPTFSLFLSLSFFLRFPFSVPSSNNYTTYMLKLLNALTPLPPNVPITQISTIGTP